MRAASPDDYRSPSLQPVSSEPGLASPRSSDGRTLSSPGMRRRALENNMRAGTASSPTRAAAASSPSALGVSPRVIGVSVVRDEAGRARVTASPTRALSLNTLGVMSPSSLPEQLLLTDARITSDTSRLLQRADSADARDPLSITVFRVLAERMQKLELENSSLRAEVRAITGHSVTSGGGSPSGQSARGLRGRALSPNVGVAARDTSPYAQLGTASGGRGSPSGWSPSGSRATLGSAAASSAGASLGSGRQSAHALLSPPAGAVPMRSTPVGDRSSPERGVPPRGMDDANGSSPVPMRRASGVSSSARRASRTSVSLDPRAADSSRTPAARAGKPGAAGARKTETARRGASGARRSGAGMLSPGEAERRRRMQEEVRREVERTLAQSSFVRVDTAHIVDSDVSRISVSTHAPGGTSWRP